MSFLVFRMSRELLLMLLWCMEANWKKNWCQFVLSMDCWMNCRYSWPGAVAGNHPFTFTSGSTWQLLPWLRSTLTWGVSSFYRRITTFLRMALTGQSIGKAWVYFSSHASSLRKISFRITHIISWHSMIKNLRPLRRVTVILRSYIKKQKTHQSRPGR